MVSLSKGVNTIARNLKYQFLTAINQHFKEGMDKHSMKHAAEMNGTRIFSYADRSNLVDLAAGFSEYMKQAHPQIKEVRHITTDHVQGFLAAKSSTVTQATLSQYGSRFAKLERLVNDSYKSCKDDRPMVAMHWEKYFQHALEKYNKTYKVELPKITPHVCRHTYCTNMAKSGMNPKTLQYLMGHSEISVTMDTYTHLGLQDAWEELERMQLQFSQKALGLKLVKTA